MPRNAFYAQSGGVTAVINATAAAVIETAREHPREIGVVYAGRKGRFGHMVEIDHGYGIRTRYAHLLKVHVKRGEDVGHRHKIGLLGSTGRSTGPHVHYEVRFDGKPLNPDKFIKAGRYVFKGK